jgi:NitT/TauT family transport system ATP-binding protein
MAFVDVQNASLRYGGESEGFLALQDATIEIQRGECIAIVGPSGCGKSSMLKLVSGLHPASTGVVRVDGEQVTRPLKIVGMAFQNPVMLPWRTTLRNVLLPLEVVEPHRSQFRSRRAQYEVRAEELLKTVGLGGFGYKYPWQLSGGMQQRASLCRALIHEPELLLLDEPFAALDAFTREELWEVLQQLWMARKFTVILVTHDLREAVYLADTVYVVCNRPGRFVHQEHIDLPRPRSLEMTYEPEFVDYVHRLRDHIVQVRQG